MDDVRAHWERVYEEKRPDAVSWFEESPERSLALIEASGVTRDAPIIDVGGGASRLVDALLDRGYREVSVLDVAEHSLAAARARLGDRAKDVVEWLVEDITHWVPAKDRYALWHDRAVFHFLTAEADRRAYLGALDHGLRPGGHLVLATFAPSGPERCSGLPVQRYGADELKAVLGPGFELLSSDVATHLTPNGARQDFTWCVFRKHNA